MFRLGLISTNFILSQAELNKKCPIYPEGYIGHMIPVVMMQLVRPPTDIYRHSTKNHFVSSLSYEGFMTLLFLPYTVL